MKINKFVINGYKNIENVEIELTNITALMSLNSRGKSNLLKGLMYGLSILISSPQVRNQIYFSNRNLSRPLCEETKDTPYFLSIAFETKLKEKKCDVEYQISIDWTSDKNIHILNEALKLRFDSSRYTTYYSREDNVVKYKATENRGCENPFNIEECSPKTIIDLLFDKKVYYQSIIEDLVNINYLIDRHFDNSLTYLSVVPKNNENEFSFGGNKPESTAENLYLLKKNYIKSYERIQSAIYVLFPEIIEINVNKIETTQAIGMPNYYELYVKQKYINEYIMCSEMSDGFKRVLNYLLSLSIAQIKGLSLVALEEPENSINPTMLGKFVQIIAEFSSSFNIIITSHSPFLLQYLSLSKIYIGIDRNNGNVDFRRIKSTYINRVNERSEKLEINTGSYIFDVLSNEDKMNKEILKEALDIK